MQYENELKVGAVILLATVAFFLGIRFFQDIPLFGGTYPMHARFEEAGGLVSGNPVHMKGVNVGSVESVSLDQETQSVHVRLQIQNDVRIPEGSHARVTGFSGLGGVRISINPGPGENPSLPPGSTLPGPPEGTVLDRLTDQAPTLATKADSVLTNTNTTMRALNQQLLDPQSDLRQTLTSLRGLTSDLEEVTDAEKANIQQLLQNLQAISGDLRAFTDQNSDSLSLAVHRLNRSLDRLNRGLASFEETSARLDALTTKMSEGDGTVGRLVNDPALYMKLDSAAAQTNRLLRDLQENPGRYLDDMTLLRVF